MMTVSHVTVVSISIQQLFQLQPAPHRNTYHYYDYIKTELII